MSIGFTENEGQFVTSSFYADDYPAWVERINREEMPRIFGDSVWEQTMPVGCRGPSGPTRRNTREMGCTPSFPIGSLRRSRTSDRPGALNRWAYGQIHPDAALGVFAREAVRELNLGEDEVTDYLGLSFSQTDAIGHDYGPLSREQLENLLHLDQVLGELMSFLDEEVGEGRWVMALTADHGVMTIPEYLVEEGEEASRATREDFSMLRRTLSGASGNGGRSSGERGLSGGGSGATCPSWLMP